MELLIGILAVIGLVAVVNLAVRWYQSRSVDPAPEADLAAPYREGLHAAVRLQTVAQDLEQQMYAEAVRRAEVDSGGEP